MVDNQIEESTSMVDLPNYEVAKLDRGQTNKLPY